MNNNMFDNIFTIKNGGGQYPDYLVLIKDMANFYDIPLKECFIYLIAITNIVCNLVLVLLCCVKVMDCCKDDKEVQ